MKKTYVKFKDLAIGDKFRVKGGRTTYTKDSENTASDLYQAKSIYSGQDVEKL